MTDTNAKKDDDYDPHDHRDLEYPMKKYEAFATYIKGSIGTGSLSMPGAFRNTGYAVGTVLMVVIPIVGLHGLHMMLRSIYMLSKRKRAPTLSYSDAMQAAFEEGPPAFKKYSHLANHLVNIFLCLYHFGACCVYIVFISKNSKAVLDYYGAELPFRVHMVLITIPLLAIFCIRSLKRLAPLTFIANFLLFFGIAIILYNLFVGLPPFRDREPINDLLKVPLFFGTVMFALESVGVIIAIESKMESPKSYLNRFGVVNMGMLFMAVLHLVVGFVGYWKFGEDVQLSLSLNFPNTILFPKLVEMLFAIGILLSYPLQGYVPADIIWNQYVKKRIADENSHVNWQLVVRLLIVLSTLLFALIVPHLSLVRSFVGSFCVSVLGFVFPALLEICILFPSNYGRYKLILWKDIGMALFGLFFCLTGSVISVWDMVVTPLWKNEI